MDEKQQAKDVFVISDEKEGRSRWVKVGAAFVNRDGSINAYLDALPLDGKLHIRDRRTTTNPKEREERS